MPATLIRRGFGALAALAAAGAFAVPAEATPADAYPTAQAIAARAEFLSQVPAPPGAGNVCVIDTGVTPLPDTASQIVERIAIDGGSGDDIYRRADNPLSGHGSFVAAMIASQVDGRGSAGIWPGAKIVSVRVFSSPNSGASAADYRVAISECLSSSRNVQVISISIAGASATPTELAKLEDRITDARNNYGVNVVASAGNNGDSSTVSYPARFPTTFAIGGTDPSGSFCAFSNRGAGLDVSSLGCNVQATSFDGNSAWFAGTSYSTPTVSGILVALRAYRHDLGAAETEQLLLDTAQRTAAGRVVDAVGAFRAAGLGHLVDAYEPPAFPSPAGPSNEEDVVTDHAITDDRPAKPRLRSASFRRGVLRVRVAMPPRGFDAIFRINGRYYVRARGSLTMRVRSWRSVSVLIEDKWGVRSKPLKVPRPRRR